MSRKGARQIVFVCISVTSAGNLLSKIIPAESHSDAGILFEKEYACTANEILGPFYKKRTQVIENTRILKFSNQTKKAIYDNWVVNAFLLKEPENQAYLVFIKRTDDKKIPLPKGTITVPVSELKFI